MKILYFFRSLAVCGGIERVLVDKMNCLVSMCDCEVYMLTSDQGNHPVPYSLDKKVHLEDLGIQFHHQYLYHGIKRLLVRKRMIRYFVHRLSDKIQEIQPDVIVCTTANYLDINILAKLKGDIPLVVESHSICCQTIVQKGLRNRFFDYMYRRGLSEAQVVVALTEGDAIEWRKVHPHVVVIPNIVHLNEGPLSTLENKRVIWVGRFDYQKRPMEMVRIWEKIQPLFPDWQLDMYGEGEQQQELEEKVCSLGINIVIHQPTERIFDCYRESSVFVSTSLFEPFGLVIPEAMSCGLPVVSYDSPYGPASIIEDGKSGNLVPYNDRKFFVEKLSELIINVKLRHQMGDKGHTISQRYDKMSIMPLWNSLFKTIKNEGNLY